jgi:dCMP deaminase
MKVAQTVASLSYCTKRKVGAILVKDDQIIATGYNGTIKGFDNTCEVNSKTLPTVLHAEANAITSCAKKGIATNNSIMFVTLSPCIDCAKLIIQAGIKKVFYKDTYKNLEGIKLLNKKGIKIKKMLNLEESIENLNKELSDLQVKLKDQQTRACDWSLSYHKIKGLEKAINSTKREISNKEKEIQKLKNRIR